ncbi:MAG: response regulator [Proteobacteria bacterium]|nr:response regulator [Pseudomonadota bacterium]MDA1327127.1 response regulator [Pseudomonadota bacterium]
MTILNDILDFSKIEAGMMELEESVFATISLMDSAVGLLGAQAHGKGLEIPTFVATDVPGNLVGDDGRIRQILLNLIGNAIKFTKNGGVSIEVSVQDREPTEDSMLLRFEIRDTGIGIHENARAQLFDQFYQVDGSHTRHYEGTGLGLAICKRLTEMMGGEIGVESDEGKGSLFWFTIRVKSSGIADGWAKDIGTVLQRRKILVVDDNQINRTIFEKQLLALGVTVTTATGAESAMRKLHEAIDAGQPFDGAIIDHFMPGTDGIDLAEMIRNMTGVEQIRLVLSSSSGKFTSDSAVKQYGFDASLPKPLRPGSLLLCARRVFGDAPIVADAARARVLSQTASNQSGGARILIAEDNHVNQKLMRALLERQGFNTLFAANGLEAVEAVRNLPFDLVLMDIKMPEMDGIEATRRIRLLPTEHARVPIIGVTANAMKGDREHVIQAGMNDYVSKPIDQKELLDKIAFWTGGGRGEHSDQSQQSGVDDQIESQESSALNSRKAGGIGS